MQAFQQAFTLGWENAKFLNRAAWDLWEKGGTLSQIEQYARYALKLSPEFNNIKHTLACILVSQGNWTEAEELARSFLMDQEFCQKQCICVYFLLKNIFSLCDRLVFKINHIASILYSGNANNSSMPIISLFFIF